MEKIQAKEPARAPLGPDGPADFQMNPRQRGEYHPAVAADDILTHSSLLPSSSLSSLRAVFSSLLNYLAVSLWCVLPENKYTIISGWAAFIVLEYKKKTFSEWSFITAFFFFFLSALAGREGGDYGLAARARCDGISADRERRQVEATVMGREMGRVGAGSNCKYRRGAGERRLNRKPLPTHGPSTITHKRRGSALPHGPGEAPGELMRCGKGENAELRLRIPKPLRRSEACECRMSPMQSAVRQMKSSEPTRASLDYAGFITNLSYGTMCVKHSRLQVVWNFWSLCTSGGFFFSVEVERLKFRDSFAAPETNIWRRERKLSKVLTSLTEALKLERKNILVLLHLLINKIHPQRRW